MAGQLQSRLQLRGERIQIYNELFYFNEFCLKSLCKCFEASRSIEYGRIETGVLERKTLTNKRVAKVYNQNISLIYIYTCAKTQPGLQLRVLHNKTKVRNFGGILARYV